MNCYWFVFFNSDLLLEKQSDGTYSIPLAEEPPVALNRESRVLNISPMENGTSVKAYYAESPLLTETRYEWCGLRSSFYKLSDELYLKAGKCHELLYWDHSTQFCGVCGTPMKIHTDISKKCPSCGKEIWPQLATAIIVLIHRGDEILLVHARNFKSDFYGLVAGFVETGETLEEAVHREVMEETGIKIENIRYFGSQPWPFPCGLMIGFNADYVSGEIKLQAEELTKGNWFTKDTLPHIPEKLSIARKILDDWLSNP